MTVMYVPLMEVGELPEPGSMKPVEREGYALMVANVDGVYRVFSRTCPHQEADLAMGALVGGRVRCGNHGYVWDLETGQSLMVGGDDPLTVMPCEVQGEELCLRLEF